MRNASRKYHLACILAIALASLWILNLPANRDGDEVFELLEVFPLGDGPFDSGDEYESKLQQPITAPKLPELQSDRDARTPVTSRQSVNDDLNLPDKVAVWGTIQTEYGETTSFDLIVLYSRSQGKIYSATSNLHGYYYIDGVQPALDYKVRVNPSGMFQQYVRRNVDLSSDQTALSVVLRALPLDVLRGRVVNSEGMAVAGMGLRVKSSQKGNWSSSFVTDDWGGFRIENVPLGGLEFLSTFGPDVLIYGHVFKGDSASPISLLVDQGSHQLNGQVRKGLDKPLAGANVTLSWTHTEDGNRSVVKRHTRTDAAGHFSIEGIGPGPHELQLSTQDGVSIRQAVEVDYPASTITFNLTAG